jgi:sulfoacetaldehyde acetyltransferase
MSLISASEAFVETLVAHGVEHVFGIVGSAYMDALDIFPAAGIRFISVAHEQNAAHMADGYARVSNRHGVCIGQNGPGITNFVTAIAAAYWAHSPVVAITPEAGSMGTGLGGFQETDQLPIFSKITKYQAHVSHPERIAELTDRALTIALHERGPTQINIPRNHFYGDIDVEIPRVRSLERPAGGPESLEAAADLLASARFPVILAGGGVVMSGGQPEAVRLAEFLSAPVVTSYLHNDAFPASHPLMCGPLGYQGSKAAMRIIAQADVVLALGSRLGPFGTLPQYDIEYWPADARIIQVDSRACSAWSVRSPSGSTATPAPPPTRSSSACARPTARSPRATASRRAWPRSPSRSGTGSPSSTPGRLRAARRFPRGAACASSRGRCPTTRW